MSSSVLELSILKLKSLRKRLGQSARYTSENDLALQPLGMDNSIAPEEKATERPPPFFSDKDLFTIFEQECAAIPFKWEASPGTRSAQEVDCVESQVLKDGMSDSDQENSSASSPPFTPSPSRSTNNTNSTSRTSSARGSESLLEEPPRVRLQATVPEFESTPIQVLPSATTPKKDNGCVHTLSDSGSKPENNSASKGKSLALKPPPGKQSIKRLLSLDCQAHGINTSCFSSRSVDSVINSSASNCTSITSLKSHHRRSFRRGRLKALPFFPAPKGHTEDLTATPILGLEEWSKVVQQQEKQEKQQQQQETTQSKGPHRRTLSMPRLAFPLKKASTAEKESSSDFEDVDSIFNEDFGMKGGLWERRAFSSANSRSLADGFTPKTRNSVFADDADYSDSETAARHEYLDCTQVIAEEDENEEVGNSAMNYASEDVTEAEAPKEKRKNDALSRLKGIFQNRSVAPAVPPPLASTQTELRWKKYSQRSKQVTKAVSSPIVKMCMANPIGQALLKNVRQLRSSEFHAHRPRAVTAK